MSFENKHLLPSDFNDDSRVWVYQSDRAFTDNEVSEIKDVLDEFVTQWKSHAVPVKGYGAVLFNQFIVFVADERATGVSGCSIDSSVRVVQQLAQKLGADLFNWQLLAFLINDTVQIV